MAVFRVDSLRTTIITAVDLSKLRIILATLTYAGKSPFHH